MKNVNYIFMGLGLILIMFSYVVLKPITAVETNMSYFWIALSVILFIVGAALAIMSLPETESKRAIILRKVIGALIGVVMIAIGVFIMIRRDFEFDGTSVFTLLLIEGLFVAGGTVKGA